MTLGPFLPVIFLFLLGACVGSFLNVVIWRLPRGLSLVSPGSHCPNCSRPLLWYDNIPIFGWLKLLGKCRFCKASISARYPIVEAFTAVLFSGYYYLFYLAPQTWPTGFFVGANPVRSPLETWPYFLLYLYLLSGLLAASAIDAEMFIIPPEIIWSYKGGIVLLAVLVHGVFDMPMRPGALCAEGISGAIALGGAMGLGISILLVRLGILPLSFADGGPMLEIDRESLAQETAVAIEAGQESPPPPREYSKSEIRKEIRKEMTFLLLPMLGAFLAILLTWRGGPLFRWWLSVMSIHAVSGVLGAIFGGLIGGFVVWLTRILFSMVLGREAMGLGDIDLMTAVGAVLGAQGATLVFFLAPVFGLFVVIYLLLVGKREVPFGPYLSFSTAVVIIFFGPLVRSIEPLSELVPILQRLIWGH